jgi:uncharacterized protein
LRLRDHDGLLATARQTVLTALAELVAGDPDDAAAALRLPAGVAAEAIEANRAVCESPTTTALQRYAGVVYDGLSFATLTPAQQRLAKRSTLIFSGLFGVVRGDEYVPRYRVPAKAQLPGVGVAGTFWRPLLEEIMPALLGESLVVDLRSSDYAAMWRADPRLAGRVVAARVLSATPRGYSVVSYNSKYGKGKLTRALIERADSGLPLEEPDDVIAAWVSAGGRDGRVDADRAGITLLLFDS